MDGYGLTLDCQPAHGSTAFIALAFGAGLGAATIVSISSPRCDRQCAGRDDRRDGRVASDGIGRHRLPGLINIAYSVASVQDVRPTPAAFRLRTRRKALQFVDEFENSGRGWFWETNNLGTLSYVSQQLADDFKCKPEELLGRQFTDLLSVDPARPTACRERTLGFHLSARFPFSDVIVAPPAMRHSLVAVGKSGV